MRIQSTLTMSAIIAITALGATSEAKAQGIPSAHPDECPSMIAQTEAQRNIPRGLLMAIAVTESAIGNRPNPYAMNIAGRSYHASGTQEMANIISANWARGTTSIDVGCMQINLKYHGQKFARLTDLLDSRANVSYGASYLISLAKEYGSWKEAVMSYHNRNNPGRRQWYGCKVWNNYLRINQARSGFVQCGRTPASSSTAAIGPVSTDPIVIAGYNAAANNRPVAHVAQARQVPRGGPLTAPSGAVAPNIQPSGGPDGYQMGNTVVDIEIPREPIKGTLTIVGAGGDIPQVVNDDARAEAFKPISPVDWSGRVSSNPSPSRPSTIRTSRDTSSGFGRITNPGD